MSKTHYYVSVFLFCIVVPVVLLAVFFMSATPANAKNDSVSTTLLKTVRQEQNYILYSKNLLLKTRYNPTVLNRVQPQQRYRGIYSYREAVIRRLLYRTPGLNTVQKEVALQAISQYPWNIQDAMSIAHCESRYVRTTRFVSAVEISHGLFQINLQAHWQEVPGSTLQEKKQWLYDPRNNTRFAYHLYKRYGWSPWYNCGKVHGLL